MLKRILRFIGRVGLLSSFVVMTITFFTAYFTESKRTLISINSFGEANIEFVLLIIVFISVCVLIKDWCFDKGKDI